MALAEAGADVAICDLLEDDGRQTTAESRALGRRSCFGKVDVTRSDEVGGLCRSGGRRVGPG